MATLEAVDFDPFADDAPDRNAFARPSRLEPVDFDPFADDDDRRLLSQTGEFISEAAKGIPRGAANVTGSMLKGLAARGALTESQSAALDEFRERTIDAPASPEEVGARIQEAFDIKYRPDRANLPAPKTPLQDRALFKAGETVQQAAADALPVGKGFEDSWTRAISEGLGSTIPFIAAGAVGGPAGLMTGVTAGEAASSGEAIERAIQAGATREQIMEAARHGQIPGLTEQLPIEVLFERVPLPFLGRFSNALGKVLGNAAAEGGQEAVQQAAQNLIAKYVYKPDQEISEGVAEAAAVGAAVGATFSTGAEAGKKVLGSKLTPVDYDPFADVPAVPEGAQPAEAIIGDELGPEAETIAAEAAPAPTGISGTVPSNIADFVTEAAARYNQDADTLIAIMMIENPRLDPNAKNPRSTAGGLFQFIDPTADQYGLENRFDPVQASDAAARLLRDNRNHLVDALGREPTPGELYLAHQQGATGATRLLSNPNALAADLVGTKAVVLNGGGGEMTAAEFAAMWTNKIDGGTTITRGPPAPITSTVNKPTLQEMLDDERPARQIVDDFRAAEAFEPTPEWQPVPEGYDTAGLDVATNDDGQTIVRRPRDPGTRENPVNVQSPEDVTIGAPATVQPTPAQAEAGNYRKRHVTFQGLPITIETEQGQERTGVDPDGKPWSVTMPAPYGYIKRTEGADGDHVDIYLGGSGSRVFVVDQRDPGTFKFDEHKVMLGYENEQAALDTYERGFSDGSGQTRIGAVTEMTVAQFRQWLKNGDNTKPVSYRKPRVRGRRAGRSGPLDILEFITQQGGIRDEGGDLAALGLSSSFQPGLGRLVRGQGLPLDRAREMAQEAGYLRSPVFGQTTSVADLLEALSENSRGNRVFSEVDITAQLEREAGARAKEEQALEAQLRADIESIIKRNKGRLLDGEMDQILSLVAEGYAIEDAIVMFFESNVAELDTKQQDQVDEAADIPIYATAANGEGQGIAPASEPERQSEPSQGIETGRDEPVGGEYDPGAEREAGSDRVEPSAEPASTRQPENEPEPTPAVEPGADGADQTVLTGAEQISDRELAERRAKGKKRPKVEQKDPGGLFGDLPSAEPDMFSAPAAPAEQSAEPATDIQDQSSQADTAPEAASFDMEAEAQVIAKARTQPEESEDYKTAQRRVNEIRETQNDEVFLDTMARAMEIMQAAEDAEAPTKTNTAAKPKERLLGQNSEGYDIVEDANGVRTMIHDFGVRHREDPGSERQEIFEIADVAPNMDKPSPAQTIAPLDEDMAPEDIPKPKRPRKPKAKPSKDAPIEDFGEKIGGARKDTVTKFRDSLEADIDVKAEPLSKSFPQPDYAKLAAEGVDPRALAYVALLRQAIPSKPRRGYKVANWSKIVEENRNMARDLISGEMSAGTLQARITKYDAPVRWHGMHRIADVMRTLPPEALPFAAKFSIEQMNVNVAPRGQEYDFQPTFVLLHDGRITKIDAKEFEDLIEPARAEIIRRREGMAKEGGKKRRTNLSLYRDRSTKDIFIGFKGLSGVIRLKAGFSDSKEARAYMLDNADALQDEIDQMRAGPNMRRAENLTRKGKQRREADVTPESFTEAFGFRGVQFGNYVEGGRRQKDLNEAFDALMDLAEILGIPSRALSLNGELGLAFGARGRGGKNAAAAHYEPGQVVINLTKNAGPGSLAHEWFHGLDNYFGKRGRASYVSDMDAQQGEIRAQVFEAWSIVSKSLKRGGFATRSAELDRARSKPYWSTPIEKAARAFERYIVDRLTDADASNDYLANIDLTGGAYPTNEEMAGDGIREAFDGLFDVMEARETKDGNVGLFTLRSVGPRSAAMSRETVGEPLSVFRNTQPMIRHADYAAAKGGDPDAALRLVGDLISQERLDEARERFGSDVIYAPIHAEEASGRNKIPVAMSETFAARAGGTPGREITQINRAYHTGAKAAERLISRPLFAGPVVPGGRYVIVDDVTVMGSTIAEMAHHIGQSGGEVVGVVLFVNASRMGDFLPTRRVINDVKRRFGDAITDEIGVQPEALTAAEAHYLRNFRDAQSFRDRVAAARLERQRRLHGKSVGREGEESLALRQRQPKTESHGKKPTVEITPAEPSDAVDAIEREMRSILDGMGLGDVALRLAETIRLYSQGQVSEADGRYFKGLIDVALDSADPISVLHHEAFHALVDAGFFTEAELKILHAKSRSTWMQRHDIERGYAGFSERAKLEEGITHAFQDWAAGRKKEAGLIARAFRKLRNFLERLSNALQGQGFQTAEDIFGRVQTGQVGRRKATAKQAAKVFHDDPMFQAAWHGSPHEFERFTLQKIGTGEGAQAFGWGLYFASMRKVAEHYRDALSRVNSSDANKWLAEVKKEAPEAIDALVDDLSDETGRTPSADEILVEFGNIVDGADRRYIQPQSRDLVRRSKHLALRTGKLYKVDIPNDNELMIWDAPLVDQPKGIKKLILDTLDQHNIKFEVRATGKAIYKALSRELGETEYYEDYSGGGSVNIIEQKYPDEKKASEVLRAAGIKGHKFLDGGSRADGDGSYNFVIYDEEAIRIEERFALRREPVTAEERQSTMLGFIARGQPIDRAIRMPFSFAGGIDKEGRWNWGKYAYDKIHETITSKKFGPSSRFAFMNNILEPIRAGLIDRYGLDPEYVQRDRRRGLDEKAILAEGAEILEGLSTAGMGPEEAAVLQAILTDGQIAEGDLQKLSDPILRSIDELGQEAVALGLISLESFERNRGAYLHRSYMKHETDKNNLSKMADRIFSSRRRRIIGKQLKGRGIFLEVEPRKLTRDDPEWETGARGEPERGEKFVIINEVSLQGDMVDADRPARVLRRVILPADKPVPAKYQGESWENKGTWELRETAPGKRVLWRDYTKAERAKMGEIMDARYNIGKTYLLMANDLSTGRFYKDIAENEEWARIAPPPEGTWRASSDYRRHWHNPDVQWVLVPNDAIANTSGKKRFGALAGKYVRAEIWRDLSELNAINTPSSWRRMMTFWKLNKTARNPVVHMNNVMSNLIFMDLADVRMQDLVRGLRAYVQKNVDFRDAEKNGAFGTDMMSQEIRENVLKPILLELERDMLSGRDVGFTSKAMMLSKMAERMWDFLKTADRKMVDVYQMEDEVFRMATYMRRIEFGDTPEQAANFARQQFLDYDIRAPWVNRLRNSVLPFISYTYRAAPLIARSIAYHPWKLPKYFAIAYALNALAYSLDEEDDEERERASFRDNEQDKTWFGIPRMVRMPWRDEHGLPVFMDVRRWIPAGDIFDMNQGQSAIPVPAPLQIGGPLALGAELFLNKQAFTGKPLVEKTDDWLDRTEKVGDWAWKSWMPSAPWVPGSWYYEKIKRAIRGETDSQDRPVGIGQALLSSTGIKVRSQDVDEEIGWRFWEIEQFERELKKKANRLGRQREKNKISEEAYNRGMRRLLEKVDRNQKRAQNLTARINSKREAARP